MSFPCSQYVSELLVFGSSVFCVYILVAGGSFYSKTCSWYFTTGLWFSSIPVGHRVCSNLRQSSTCCARSSWRSGARSKQVGTSPGFRFKGNHEEVVKTMPRLGHLGLLLGILFECRHSGTRRHQCFMFGPFIDNRPWVGGGLCQQLALFAKQPPGIEVGPQVQKEAEPQNYWNGICWKHFEALMWSWEVKAMGQSA